VDERAKKAREYALFSDGRSKKTSKTLREKEKKVGCKGSNSKVSIQRDFQEERRKRTKMG